MVCVCVCVCVRGDEKRKCEREKKGGRSDGNHTYLSLSPIHLDTRSAEDTDMKVEFASVATALARYDLPVPGG